ncbi:NAD(P)-dependent oxidoreductase [Dankookia sp. P2]|uniref:NAD(P)-dependent oxidoreductase n=1 Tax=Dankookia sp. P2 TaxID=3423955 RepID=UPI003D667A98
MSNRRVMVVKSGGPQALVEWRDCFAALDPGLELVDWDAALRRRDEIDYALVWDPEPGGLATMPRLRAIFGSGAGVDGILLDTQLAARRADRPHGDPRSDAADGRVLCLGGAVPAEGCAADGDRPGRRRMGLLRGAASRRHAHRRHHGARRHGARCAAMLQALGFPVIGWSRGPKDLPGVESFAGPAALPAFLARSDILVSLLPATPETRDIIRAETLAMLPQGAGYIGIGRGMQHRLDDILAALDSGQLSGTVLDVFEPEPLPAGHPLWRHPKATITPHVASLPSRAERAGFVARTIAGFERGETLPNLFDPARGY